MAGLNAQKQDAIIRGLADGLSIRAVERITGVHRDTVMRLRKKVLTGYCPSSTGPPVCLSDWRNDPPPLHRAERLERLSATPELLSKARAAASAAGLNIQIIHMPLSYRLKFAYKHRVEIDGIVCYLRRAIKRHAIQSGVSIQGLINSHGRELPDDVQFICYLLPDNRWLIIPRELLPNERTEFCLGDVGNYGRKSARRDWRFYVDAWHLIPLASSWKKPAAKSRRAKT